MFTLIIKISDLGTWGVTHVVVVVVHERRNHHMNFRATSLKGYPFHSISPTNPNDFSLSSTPNFYLFYSFFFNLYLYLYDRHTKKRKKLKKIKKSDKLGK